MAQRKSVVVICGTQVTQPDASLEDDPAAAYESLIPGMSRDNLAYPYAVRALLQLAQAGFDAKDPELAQRAATVGQEHYVASLRLVPATPTPVPPPPAKRLKLRAQSGWVYYMRLGNRCKIGYTTNLARRVLVLVPEEILAIEPGTPDLETQRHDEFTQFRTHAEWFRFEGALVDHVARVAEEMDEVARGVVSATVRPKRRYRSHLQRRT